VFKIIIHLDVVEDLMLYHYPRDELIADGKVPWREFSWQYGLPDGDNANDDSVLQQRKGGIAVMTMKATETKKGTGVMALCISGFTGLMVEGAARTVFLKEAQA
jgi:hypothetical protein